MAPPTLSVGLNCVCEREPRRDCTKSSDWLEEGATADGAVGFIPCRSSARIRRIILSGNHWAERIFGQRRRHREHPLRRANDLQKREKCLKSRLLRCWFDLETRDRDARRRAGHACICPGRTGRKGFGMSFLCSAGSMRNLCASLPGLTEWWVPFKQANGTRSIKLCQSGALQCVGQSDR